MLDILSLIIALVVAITVHEAAHALAASKLGDPTARLAGRVSLNPMVHLDPIGTFMIIITFLTGFGIGWGKPVPVNLYNLKDPRKDEALIALAGPMANFTVAAIIGFILKHFAVSISMGTGYVLTKILILNIGLMVFNLIPVPPLDGSKILYAFLPDRYYAKRPMLERRGPIILILVIIVGDFLNIPIIGWVIMPLFELIYNLVL